jgi:hypothetical protein
MSKLLQTHSAFLQLSKTKTEDDRLIGKKYILGFFVEFFSFNNIDTKGFNSPTVNIDLAAERKRLNQ